MTDAADSIAAAEALVDKNLPRGWAKVFVEPPWRGLPPLCRGCGRSPSAPAVIAQPRWANVAIVKHDQARKRLYYSFGLCCDKCGTDRATMNRLALEVFQPLARPRAPELVATGKAD